MEENKNTDALSISDYFIGVDTNNNPYYKGREFIVFEIENNYFINVPKMKLMYFKSTNTSNELGNDLWYFTPGIGRDRVNDYEWIVKNDNDNLYQLIFKYLKDDANISQLSNTDDGRRIIKIYDEYKLSDDEKKAEHQKQLFDLILGNYCSHFGRIFNNETKWELKLLNKISKLYGTHIFDQLTDKEVIGDSQRLSQITHLYKLPKFDEIDAAYISSVLLYKQYNIPCYFITRYKYYYKLQLGIQLSHDLWDLFIEIKDPMFEYIINHDYDYVNNTFVERESPLKKIQFPKLKILNFDTKQDYIKYINNVYEWKPKYYNDLKKMKFNETPSIINDGSRTI